MGYTLRKATVSDVPQMQRLVNAWAKQGVMLPRSLHSLYEHLRDYLVAVDGERMVGCVSLHVTWEDLAEIRTLAVAPESHGQGVGRRLVEQALQDARDLGLTHIFVLTYVRASSHAWGSPQPTKPISRRRYGRSVCTARTSRTATKRP